jgi:hypothetical protein
MLMGGDSMSMIFFTFRAPAKARQGAMILRKAGITARLAKTPAALAKNGCGYGLWVPEAQAHAAAMQLKAMGAAYERSYRMNPQEEVWL